MHDHDLALRALPRVDAVIAAMPTTLPPTVVAELARAAIAGVRTAIVDAREAGRPAPAVDAAAVVAKAVADAEALLAPALRRIINATGVVLHTNLGRAPLSPPDPDALGYTNLEYDVADGTRGSRNALLKPLLAALTGAESALTANNTAAALMLAVATFASGREVIIARGELVEIGDSFRLPEILECSGARLREVGTTNRVTLADYARAIGPETGAILKVYPSNYRIVGFTDAPPVAELIALATRHHLPSIVDLGSDPLSSLALVPEADTKPSARSLIAAGADVVMFSGDKELGGPQAGIVVGRAEALRRIGRHPWMRAMRLDKLRLASLTEVLAAHLTGNTARIPTHRYLNTPVAQLETRAAAIVAQFAGDARVTLTRTDDAVGGGAHPETAIPGYGVALQGHAHRLVTRLRLDHQGARPPIIARVHQDSVILSLRAVEPHDDAVLVDAIKRSLDTP